MKGLLLKDLLNLKQQWKIFVLIIAVWTAIAFADSDPDFLGGVMMILAVMMPISAMAYDEKAKWDRYAMTMPVSRRDIVLSKYLLALLISAVSFILSTAAGAVISGSLTQTLLSTVLITCVAFILVSVVLPVMFRFGVEKGRMAMLAVVLIPTLLITFAPRLGISMPSFSGDSFPVLLPVIALAALALSGAISVRIYSHKEF